MNEREKIIFFNIKIILRELLLVFLNLEYNF